MGKGKFSFDNRRNPDPDEILTPAPEELDPIEDQALPKPEEEAAVPQSPEEEETAFPPSDEEPEEAWDAPADDTEEEAEPLPSPVRGNRTGTLIFYTLYILFVLGFALSLFSASRRLNDWLTDYQLSQPTDKRDQVFGEYFADPNWPAVYAAAGIEDTAFEGEAAFTAYMEALVGSEELSWVETSTGLSGNKKYFVKLGEESIASFLLVSEVDAITGLPRWELGGMDTYFHRGQSITVLIRDGQTAYVNGVALDESHTVRVDASLASRYLPTGIYPDRSYTLTLSGLLMEPEITVRDEDGLEVTVHYEEARDLYFTDAPVYPTEIPDGYLRAVTDAAEAYAGYLLGEEGAEEIFDQHFDRTTDASRQILTSGPLDQEDVGYEYVEETVTDFHQYAEDLFSVRVSLLFHLTDPPADPEDPDDKKKDEEEAPTDEPEEYRVEHTLFFRYRDGSWVCIGLTQEEAPVEGSRVKITFVMDDVVISDYYYDTDLRSMTVPLVSAPEGRLFAGWYREETAPDGSTALIPVFQPDASGTVILSGELPLEPMTLYALFEDATIETEVTE